MNGGEYLKILLKKMMDRLYMKKMGERFELLDEVELTEEIM